MKKKMIDGTKCRPFIFFILVLNSMILLHMIYPASPAAMDLLEAYNLAKKYDPLLGASFFEHEASNTLPAQGRAYLLPQVQAFGTQAKYHYDTGPYYYDDFNSQVLGVSAKQPIVNVPRFYEYRQHKIRKKIGDVRFISAEQDLIIRLTEAYFNGLAASDLLYLVNAEKKAVVEQRQEAKKRFDAGVGTITDVHDAEARNDSVLAREIEAKNDLDIKMQALKRIVGVDPHVLIPLKKNIPLGIPEPGRVEDWIQLARKNHPLLKSYAYQVDYQEAEVKKNKGQHWPSLDLVGGYNKTNTNNAVIVPNLTYGTVGVQLNLPVFNGGYTTAKVRESGALMERARKEYENVLADVTQKLNEAFLNIRSNMKKIEALLTANKSAATSLESNRMSLMAGVRTTIDVLNAERELQQVQTRLLQARYDSLLNIVRLKAHAGILSEADLREINQWLQN